MQKVFSRVVLWGLLSAVSASSLEVHADFRASNGTKDAGKIVLVAGAVCAGLYGLYKFACWLFRKSDERVISDARHLIMHSAEYNPALYAFYSHTIVDDRLDALAPLLAHDETMLHTYKNALHAFEVQCRQAMHEVADRAHALDQKIMQHAKVDRAYDRMKEQLEKLQSCHQSLAVLVPQLDDLSSFMAMYEPYFALYSVLENVRTQYNRELAAVTSAGVSYDAFIDRCIMDNAAYYGYQYPYITYVDALNAVMKRISQYMHTVATLHVGVPLRARAHDIVHMLDAVRASAVRGGELGAYYRECEHKRADDFKREELRIKRELARAQERKAAALERTARVKEKEAEERRAQERRVVVREYSVGMLEHEDFF